MGICLDTDQQNGSQVFAENDTRATGRWRGEAGLLATPPDGHFPKQNIGPVKFEIPKVPVIFVLGGPGSGKVTYCDNLIQERKGITHINMMDLLQQYALGNDMQDFGQLSSKTVTEVLMLEMKMSPEAKVFLVSGYPRNMRDVVEYAEKIKIVNGVILVSWRQEVLERQIDFGAQLGHVIIGLARMELHNFYRNVMPVAEYFDQSGMLLEVEVERRKESITDSPPQQIVTINRLSSPMSINGLNTADKPRKGLPSFIWVIGGPGSNKTTLCTQAVRNMSGWLHISIGELLRTMASSNVIVNDAIVSGEMVSHDIVIQLVEQQILLNRDSDGIVIDGYPRDLNQVQEFESKFGQKPPLILLDCSKLQLGRGRLDDSVSAFRKRLELFREISLPMLKTLDSDNRLTIVDGDTDVSSVQQDFAIALYQLMHLTRRKEEQSLHNLDSSLINGNSNKIQAPNEYQNEHAIPNGLAKPMANTTSNHIVIDTKKNGIISRGGDTTSNSVLNNMKHIHQNGHIDHKDHQNGFTNGTTYMQNDIAHLSNGILSGNSKIIATMHNYLPKDPIRKMYNEVEGYQQNLHM
ncbi:adenylate kinase isoenzyme 5 isoform X2 [Pogonomyrmex barbatus]|uniref:Adenylate kinase isoenzyme 5 isoform X2 n=1 Tax=Pogonomyrmex barbatus TaxID=144034 RepID=A0A6I9WDW0_9HYME|nr:adenylate kinase isoenzyme 5 isoform X2 [Pogonomyrmex barbatus]